MSKNKLLIIMMTLLTTSALGGVYFTHAQEVDENLVAAENLLSLLEESKAEVTTLFETIVNDGGEVSEDAQEAFEEAQQLQAQAQTLFDETNHEECLKKAAKASNKYGKALTKATSEETEETEIFTTLEQEETEETEKMTGITTAIDKARKRIEKLEKIAEKLEEQGIDVSEVDTILTDASEILDSISLEDTEEAEEKLALTNNLIGETTELLKSNGESIKEEKIEHFRNQAMHHVEQLSTKMNRFMEKFGSSEEHSLMMQTQYSEIIARFDEIDTKDGLKDAVNQLKWLEKETRNVGKDSIVEEVMGEDTIESINNQMKLESKLEYYWGLVSEMQGDDPLKVEVEDLLVKARGLLDDAETALLEGDEDLADEKVEEAEEILETIDDLLGDGEGKGKESKTDKTPTNQGKSNGNSHDEDGEQTEGDPEDPEEPENPEDPESDTD